MSHQYIIDSIREVNRVIVMRRRASCDVEASVFPLYRGRVSGRILYARAVKHGSVAECKDFAGDRILGDVWMEPLDQDGLFDLECRLTRRVEEGR